MHKKHAIIVGAGAAGLTAAYYLAKDTNIKPIVLEKKNFVGGLARTMNFDGNFLDVGGHRFFSENDEILKLWKEILPEDFLNRRLASKIFFRQKIFSRPISANFETIKNLGLLETFSIGASFLKSKISRRDEKNLEDVLINRCGQKVYEDFFRDNVTKIFGRPPEEIPADCARKIFENPPPESFYPKFGCGQMWEKFSDAIKNFGGEVLTCTKVKNFRVVDGVIKSVRVESAAGLLTFPADYFLSTMPLDELAESLDDGLNFGQVQIARKLEYRDFMSVGLLVEKILLETDAATIQIHEPSVKISRVQIFNNWSPQIVADAKNSVWLGLEYFCDATDELWQMSDDDFIKFAANELAAIGFIDAADVRFGVRVKVPKAVPVSFDEREKISELHDALDAIKNLYCIGRGLHRCDKIDRAMATAIAAVCAIVGKFSKADIRKIFAQKEFY